MKTNKLVLFFSMFFAAAMIYAIPVTTEASSVNCGDTITTSTTLTSNLNCTGNGLTIGANNITLDCNGYTIQGAGAGTTGVSISGPSQSGFQNVTVKNCNIKSFSTGITLYYSSNNTLTNNTVTSNSNYGIYLTVSNSNTLINNTVNSNGNVGIYPTYSNSNTLINNTVNSNYYGIFLFVGSSNNAVFHNNIINNAIQAVDFETNSWNFNGGGNYWSDFDTPQEGCYDNNANGICDSPKLIYGGNNKDHFPFTNQNGWQTLNEYSVDPFTDALYHLDEGGGSTAVDATGKHNGTLQKVGTNFPAWTGNTAPLTGSTYAMEFDGDQGYVDVSNGLLDNPFAFTIETWFNLQGMPKTTSVCGSVNCFMLLSKNTDDDLTSLFQLFYESTNVIGVNVYSGGTLYRADYTFPYQILNQWHHVAATYDGSVLKLFVDGIQADSVNIPTALNSVTSSFFIGKDGRNNFPDRVFKGYLDEVRISNYARNPCQFNVNFGSCPATVLLIHGIYSDDTIWGSVESFLQSAGFQVFKVGQVLGKKGLVPNNGDISVLAEQVQQAIQKIKATGVSKVNVIAHSMGGLATRSYISTGNYQNDIDKLITLGTPNEGAPIAKNPFVKIAQFFGVITKEDPNDTAREQMIPDSGFLKALNSNFNTKGVSHTEIAGIFTNPSVYTVQLSYLTKGLITDSIVPRPSVNIPNITCYQDLVVHTNALKFLYIDPYYEETTTINAIIDILNGNPVSLNQCPPGTLKSTNGQTSNAVQGLLINDLIFPYQIKTAVSNTDLGTQFNAYLTWVSGQLNLQFISPTGIIIDSTNYQNYPGTSYGAGTNAQGPFETFTFTQPEQGNWTVNVIATLIGAPQQYTLNLAMEKNIQLSISTDKTNYIPNEQFIVNSSLTDTNTSQPVLNAVVLATVIDPSNATSSLTLFDDGLHNDGLANDGVYGNSYINTSQEGVYLITVDGSISGQFQIQDTHAVFVDLQPDLSIQSQDISFNPSVLSKNEDNNITVTATIFNIGDEDATNVEIDFYDGDPMKGGNVFATTSVSVLTGGSTQTQANLFVPKQQFGSAGAGKASGTALKDHDIHIVISSYSGFIEKDYTNNQASKLLKYGR